MIDMHMRSTNGTCTECRQVYPCGVARAVMETLITMANDLEDTYHLKDNQECCPTCTQVRTAMRGEVRKLRRTALTWHFYDGSSPQMD